MKFNLIGDERYPCYWAYSDIEGSSSHHYILEMNETDWAQWLRDEAAYEAWQDKFHEMYKAESKRRTLENSKKNGIPSKGF